MPSIGKNYQPFFEIKATVGINNVDTSLRIPFQSAKTEFLTLTNVDIDDTGGMSRRSGLTSFYTGTPRSLWSDGSLCLFMESTSLKRLNSNGTATTLKGSLSASAEMRYVKVNDRVYFTNGETIGYVEDGLAYDLTAPTGYYEQTMRSGHEIEYYNGRLYVGSGGTLWFSQPHNFSAIDLRYNWFMLPGRITMLKAVDDGIYVSCGATYFLKGGEPEEFELVNISADPAIESTAVSMDAMRLGRELPAEMFPPYQGTVVVYVNTKGNICSGGNNGRFVNLTHGRYAAPSRDYGTGVLRYSEDGTCQYLTVLHN